MFGLFKKKNKNTTPTESAVVEKKEPFRPSFGSIEDFKTKYGYGEEGDLQIAKGLSVKAGSVKDILLINNDRQDAVNRFVLPILRDARFSYVVYDPDGLCHKQEVYHMLSSNGYDVQEIDFSDPENKTRLDLFEIVNITKNPYWQSMLITSSILCKGEETQYANNLMMGMMQYLLSVNRKITIDSLYSLFQKLRENDTATVEKANRLRSCNNYPPACEYLKQFNEASVETKKLVYAKFNSIFFKTALEKTYRPNTFTIACPKKQTVFFIKKTASQYRYLVTTLLFNIMMSSTVGGYDHYNTILFDTEETQWYNRALIRRLCGKDGRLDTSGVVTVRVREKIDDTEKEKNKELILFMHSDDEKTKQYIHESISTQKTLSDIELSIVSNKFFKGKSIPEDVLKSAPIGMDKIGNLQDMLVIDSTRATKPFLCETM